MRGIKHKFLFFFFYRELAVRGTENFICLSCAFFILERKHTSRMAIYNPGLFKTIDSARSSLRQYQENLSFCFLYDNSFKRIVSWEIL